MANILNRAEYGNLSCLWSVVRSRFTSTGGEIELKLLKHSKNADVNAIDICPARLPLPGHIAQKVGRDYFCPYLKSRTDPRVCQWVHSEAHDPQKSKPVGQTAVVLEALGLCDLITSQGGIARRIRWTEAARRVSGLAWGSAVLDEIFEERILAYGPAVALLHYLDAFHSEKFRKNELYGKLKILPTGEVVNPSCAQGTSTSVRTWDGNTSNDPVIRTTTSLLNLMAGTGVVRPEGYLESSILSPSGYSDWLNQRAQNGKKTFPRVWFTQKERLEEILTETPVVARGIGYRNFIPKATDRNAGNRCSCCTENVVNNARRQFGYKSQNRKLLLLKALQRAIEIGSCVDLKRLTEVSLAEIDFFVSTETQYRTVLNIERRNVFLYGLPNQISRGHMLVPLVKTSDEAFRPYPAHLEARIESMFERSEALFVG